MARSVKIKCDSSYVYALAVDRRDAARCRSISAFVLDVPSAAYVRNRRSIRKRPRGAVRPASHVLQRDRAWRQECFASEYRQGFEGFAEELARTVQVCLRRGKIRAWQSKDCEGISGGTRRAITLGTCVQSRGASHVCGLSGLWHAPECEGSRLHASDSRP